ncbi:HNH endonuclease signature motif containing protein [Actinopolymorpha cephalotaxi]|uniref:HNH nuclease domain-containing protein n=1 Tax=Actinopolymorpha cephalotaxi TaxID=504797 RepID=A0ABX2SAI2_9ACTN|nr:HNH endonuclease signature motif containing protein [Actinopolymorpha cephalotaxi]NYH86351.1 hypothetical protein [Actinopolymorpha cephalotaxi]
MSSSEWGAWTGGDAVGRILAALDRVDAPLDEAWVAPKGGLKPEDIGAVIAAARAKKARLEALELDLVALAEACDIGRLTGSPNATVYLRTAQRLAQREASAVVGLARDLGKVARLTLEAMAAGAVSAQQAKVIAEAIKKLPEYVGADERHRAEEFLIEKAAFANPDELRGMGESLLERIAPEEAERLEGEELAKKDRKAEQKRSLRYLPNGIPQSETVRITLPSWEMELFRKIIEPLAVPVKGAEPDTRPIDQRRGDAFAELIPRLAGAAPTSGGRPPQVTVTIPIDTLLTGVGAGFIDNTATPVRPRPCTCPCTDPKYGTTKDTGNTRNAKNARQARTDGEPTPEEAAGQERARETQPGMGKRPPSGTGSPTDGIPPPRTPDQPHHPQPNTDPEPEPRTATGSGTEPDPHTGQVPGRDAEPDQGAVGLKDAIDPHDGCPKCGGGGSARYLGTDGKPISAATVRRLACEADLIPVVLAGDGQVLDLGRSDRFFREHQRRALAIRDGSHCHFPGCQIPEPRCITHHMTAWDHGGPTDLNNGVLLCRFHHVTVHHKGWQVRMGAHGHPEYVPPEWVDPQQRVLRP